MSPDTWRRIRFFLHLHDLNYVQSNAVERNKLAVAVYSVRETDRKS